MTIGNGKCRLRAASRVRRVLWLVLHQGSRLSLRADGVGEARTPAVPKRIERDEAQRLIEDGAQVVEVLGRSEYEWAHLPGGIRRTYGEPLVSADRATCGRRARSMRTRSRRRAHVGPRGRWSSRARAVDDHDTAVVSLPEPMLAGAARLPTGGDFPYEVKWDGFRAVVSTEGSPRVRSRRGGWLLSYSPGGHRRRLLLRDRVLPPRGTAGRISRFRAFPVGLFQSTSNF
jgi:hypothetical protein